MQSAEEHKPSIGVLSKLPSTELTTSLKSLQFFAKKVAEARQKHLEQVSETLSEGWVQVPPLCWQWGGGSAAEPKELHQDLHLHSPQGLSSLGM